MKKITILALLAALALCLSGTALGTETAAQLPQVPAPEIAAFPLGAEIGQMVRLPRPGRVQAMNGLFTLEGGYVSAGFESHDEYTIGPFPVGGTLTCLNRDLSVRWELTDSRLDGAWYTDLVELESALLFGSERSAPEGDTVSQRPSMLLLDKATGEILWQMEELGQAEEIGRFVWITDFAVAEGGDIFIASRSSLPEGGDAMSSLTRLSGKDGAVLWSIDCSQAYGMHQILSVCTFDGGLLLYGDDRVVYTDMQGAGQGFFTVDLWPWQSDEDGYTLLGFRRISDSIVYLGGWETEWLIGEITDVPYRWVTLLMMRITPDTFAVPEMYSANPYS